MRSLCFYFIFLFLPLLWLTECSNNKGKNTVENNNLLRAATLYGPTSYFIYRDEPMGYEYENIKKVADSEGKELDLKIAPSLFSLLEMLNNGEIELIAYPVPMISEYINNDLKYVGPREITWQVLIQKNNEERIFDVTELIGKEIHVIEGSRYHYRLLNLNEELGGGIKIKLIDKDSISDEDLIQMVHEGKISYTITDSDIASINRSYYPDLDISLKLSFEQYSSWVIKKENEQLAAIIENNTEQNKNRNFLLSIYKKYFEYNKTLPSIEEQIAKEVIQISDGENISPYDNLFKQYGKESGIDWQLLAAIAFKESRFDPNATSRFGASGLMQVMPSTAKELGVDPGKLISHPEENIKAAVRLLVNLNEALLKKVNDEEERKKFVIAAYNSGLGHIYDAIALSRKLGLDTAKWQGNVREALLLKSNPIYYNEDIVKHGYLRGSETVEFVDNVETIYNYLKNNIKRT